MPITAAAQTIYATSASISQNISLNSMTSLGVRGSAGIYNPAPPKGQVSFSYYEDGSFSVFDGLTTSQTLVIGPYTITNAYLTSLSFNGEPNAPIAMDQSWDFYGTVTAGALPPVTTTSITTYMVQNLAGYDELGGGRVFTFGYSSSASYEARHLLASVDTTAVWKGGEVSLDLEGDELTNLLTDSTSSVCVTPKSLSLVMQDSCDPASTTTISVIGHMTSRDVESSPGDINRHKLNVIKYL